MTQTQTQTIAQAQDLVAFAAQMLARLYRAEQRLRADEAGAANSEPRSRGAESQSGIRDEARWLGDAQRRVVLACEETWSALVRARPLPEFEAEHRAKGQALLTGWVNSVEGLLAGITEHVSIHNPIVEVLFPHQNFEKLRRNAAQAREYKTDFERRRATTYVVRLAGEPEYAFLPPLLARVDRARAALAAHEAPSRLSADELESLRAPVLESADALDAALAQARLLARAALIGREEWIAELGLEDKPRRRSRAP